MKREYPSYTQGEAVTGIGQVVEFTCASEDAGAVKTLLEEKVRHVEIPVTHVTNVSHGGYGRYSRYKIEQHKYAGGRSGFIEVVEIKNPLEKMCPFIIYEYNSHYGSCFSEWEDSDSAKRAFEKNWGSNNWHEGIAKISGFKRLVKCGPLTPWFYAVGDEVVMGDYAIASGLENDPVFRLGRKFVFTDEHGVSKIKTCMGSRLVIEHGDGYSSSGTSIWRMVYWDDGTALRIHKDNCIDGDGYFGGSDSFPRLLHDEEVWIAEACEKFSALLSGLKEGFQMKFDDGRVLTVKLSSKGKRGPSAAGDYLVKATRKNHSTKEGWVRGFVPTAEHPDIVSFILAKYEGIAKIKILKSVPEKDGKKWHGAFFVRSEV